MLRCTDMRQSFARIAPAHVIPSAYPWAQTPLAALAGELAAISERDEVVPAVLRAAVRLLHAEVAALSLYDAHGRPHTIAVASADRHWSPSRSLAAKVPLPRDAIGASGDVLVLPTDDPQHPFAVRLARIASRAIYITLGDDSATFGVLHAVRPAACPFSPEDRKLARGIGDHAVLA